MRPGTDALIALALAEDVAFGDLTSEAIFSSDHRARGFVESRQDLVLCGVDVAAAVFRRVHAGIEVECVRADGTYLPAGKTVLKMAGPTAAMLMAERTALNFLQRLSGIATLARRFAELAEQAGTGVRVVDTRKTTPGWRALEKYAVRCGGCGNHRFSLGEHVLIKDNHIAATGSIREAVRRVRSAAPHTAKIAVEAATLKQVQAALSAGAEVILLDNMTPAQIVRAVDVIDGAAVVEVSGGVGLDNFGDYALPGVNVISIGALTHSAPAADLGMSIEPRPQRR